MTAHYERARKAAAARRSHTSRASGRGVGAWIDAAPEELAARLAAGVRAGTVGLADIDYAAAALAGGAGDGSSRFAMLASLGFGPGAPGLESRLRGGSVGPSDDRVQSLASAGLAGASGALPHAERIQQAFGAHDLSRVRAGVGGTSEDAAAEIGARAFASGERVVFGAGHTDLWTAAHEAAHVIQQRRGEAPPGGVGRNGDRREREADAVADAVVAGHGAEALLGPVVATAHGNEAVQRSPETVARFTEQLAAAERASRAAPTPGTPPREALDALRTAAASFDQLTPDEQATQRPALQRVQERVLAMSLQNARDSAVGDDRINEAQNPERVAGYLGNIGVSGAHQRTPATVNGQPVPNRTPADLQVVDAHDVSQPWCGAFVATHYRTSGGFERRFAGRLGGVGGVAAFFDYSGPSGRLEVRVSEPPDATWMPIREEHERRGALRTWRNASEIRAIVDAALARDREHPDLSALDLRPGDIVVVNNSGDGGGDHITMVSSFEPMGGRLVTIEGNSFTAGVPTGWSRSAAGDQEWLGAVGSVDRTRELTGTEARRTRENAGTGANRPRSPVIWGAGRPSVMDFESHDYRTASTQQPSEGAGGRVATGRSAATGAPAIVQRHASGSSALGGADARALAELGLTGSGGSLPHLSTLQPAFGRHDLTQVHAFTGEDAARAASDLGATAFAAGDRVAFGSGATDLWTAAHEAAHVVQQRRGISVPGGLGTAGDRYEAHADAVADAVVSGRNVEGLLDGLGQDGTSAGRTSTSIQRNTGPAAGRTPEQNVGELRDALQRFRNHMAGDRTTHQTLARAHAEQPTVAAASNIAAEAREDAGRLWDRVRGRQSRRTVDEHVQLPPLGMWAAVEAHLSLADRAVQSYASTRADGDLQRVRRAVDSARAEFETCHRRVVEYQQRTVSGGETSETALRGVIAVCALVATIATGGAAAAGLSGTSAVVAGATASAATAGGLRIVNGAAEQVSEIHHGLRTTMDVERVLFDAGAEMATTFIGALTGGCLAGRFTSGLARRLAAGMRPEQLAQVMERVGAASATAPAVEAALLGAGRRVLVDFISGALTSPLATAVSAALDLARGRRMTADQFVARIIEDLVHGGVVQLFLGAAMHGAQAVGGRRNAGGAQPAHEPVTAAHDPAAVAPTEHASLGAAPSAHETTPSGVTQVRTRTRTVGGPAAGPAVEPTATGVTGDGVTRVRTRTRVLGDATPATGVEPTTAHDATAPAREPVPTQDGAASSTDAPTHAPPLAEGAVNRPAAESPSRATDGLVPEIMAMDVPPWWATEVRSSQRAMRQLPGMPAEIYQRYTPEQIGRSITARVAQLRAATPLRPAGSGGLTGAELRAQSEICMIFDHQRLPNLQRDGLLNAHQVGRSGGGINDLSGRASAESRIAGVNLEPQYQSGRTPTNAVRPRYALLNVLADRPVGTPRGSTNIDAYGDVMAVMHEHVRDRTTFTNGDTYGGSIRDQSTLPQTFGDERPHLDMDGGYFETQTWGDVHVDRDVAEFRVRPGTNPAVVEQLAASGKPVFEYTTETVHGRPVYRRGRRLAN
ncbi:MAG: DUF4157 domain-containing protein [Myxococcales bacterium]|nr:DUF4157 domain-containing protein [Myxococcales bacterium]